MIIYAFLYVHRANAYIYHLECLNFFYLAFRGYCRKLFSTSSISQPEDLDAVELEAVEWQELQRGALFLQQPERGLDSAHTVDRRVIGKRWPSFSLNANSCLHGRSIYLAPVILNTG
jgi:hypothetical protein